MCSQPSQKSDWHELKPLKPTYLRYSFFNTSVADVYRAMNGGCLLGSFVLLFCSMDAMSQIYASQSLDDESEKKICDTCQQPIPLIKIGNSFRKWIRTFLKKESPYVEPQFLYELRCGLVHAHGSQIGSRLNYSLTHRQPELHWNGLVNPQNEKGYILNLESMLAEYVLATANCFDVLESAWTADIGKMVANLNRLVSLFQGPMLIEPPEKFATMHPSLGVFDDNDHPTLSQIELALLN